MLRRRGMYAGSVLSAGKTDRSFTEQVGKCECSGAIAENWSKRFALTPELYLVVPATRAWGLK